jgi:putative ABC transport system permease protein
VAQRLQVIRGAQVVTMTEMMGTFLNLLGAVRTLVLAVGAIAVTAATLTVFNTLLAAVVDRSPELATMRALGASRPQVFALLLGEALLLTWAGAAAGTGLSRLLGPGIEAVARGWLPIASGGSLLEFSGKDMLACWLLAGVMGLLAAVYPAWRAATVSPATGAGQRR